MSLAPPALRIGRSPAVAPDGSVPTVAAPRGRGVLRALAAVAAGGLLSVAFPPHGWWWLSPVALAALVLLVEGRRPRAAYGLGVLFGLGFLVPLLAWSRIAGDDGWLILSLLQSLILGLVGPLCLLANRLPAMPLWVATTWVLQEAVRDRVPFGGFPWARLAFVQPSGGVTLPVTRLAALGGAPLVTFAVALAGGLLAAAIRQLVGRRDDPADVGRRPWRAIVPLAGMVLVLAGGLSVGLPVTGQPGSAPGAEPASSVQVAAIQGNVPRSGLDWMGQRRAVTRNHLQVTRQLAADVGAGLQRQPDLVLWPENSSDLDPFLDPKAAAILSDASRAIGRPILVGAVLEGPGERHVRNAGLVWGPDGYLGTMYVKRHPVPFGEYLPGRPVLEKLVGRFAASLPNDFLPGRAPGVLDVPGRAGSYRVGDVICFEVAYDGITRDVVDGGARLLVVQTNNATFGRSGETYQQLAMSRLRAVEHGRSTVVVATSGTSALIRPDGTVLARSGLYVPAALDASLPLRSSTTVADHLGSAVEYALVALGVLGPVLLLVRRRRSAGASSHRRATRGAPGGGPSGEAGSQA